MFFTNYRKFICDKIKKQLKKPESENRNLHKGRTLLERFFTIKYKVFFAFIGLTASFLIIIGIVINQTYAKSLCENEENYNILATDKLESDLDNDIDITQNTATFLTTSDEINRFISEDPNASQFNLRKENARILLNHMLEMEPFIYSIQIFGKDQKLSTTLPEKNLQEMYEYYEKQLADNHYLPTWSDRHTLMQGSSKNVAEVVSYIYPFRGTGADSRDAIAVINISYEYIQEKFIDYAIEANEKAFICNSQGEIILNYPNTTSFEPIVKQYPQILKGDDRLLNEKVFGVDTILVSKSLNNIQWKIIRVIPEYSITVQTKKMASYLQWVMMICGLISFLAAILLAQTITKPIHKLSQACKHVEKGNLTYHLSVRGRDEFSQLEHTFNLMIDRINTLLTKELEDQKQKADLQFQVLEAQINPHFLYNSLDSIKWLVSMQNMNNIADMITALINLLKYNLSSHDTATTLKDEVDSVRNYITIEKFRYLDTFEFNTHLDENTLNCKVIRFILQPLVENSILHGFQDMEQDCKIEIASFRTEDALHIKVIDNGSGMNREEVQQINEGQKGDHYFKNIGVSNIQKRIKLYCGEDYGLVYQSKPGEGTVAEITLPIR